MEHPLRDGEMNDNKSRGVRNCCGGTSKHQLPFEMRNPTDQAAMHARRTRLVRFRQIDKIPTSLNTWPDERNR